MRPPVAWASWETSSKSRRPWNAWIFWKNQMSLYGWISFDIYIYDIYDVYIYIHIKQGIVLLLKLAVSCDSRAVFFFYAHWVGLHCWSWMIFHGKLLVITRWLWLTWFNQRENDGVHQSWSVHGYAYTMLCCIQLQLTLNFGHCRRHGGVRVTRHINGHFRILNWRYLPYI